MSDIATYSIWRLIRKMSYETKILVAGSSGFLGSHLVQEFKFNKYNVIELDLELGFDINDWDKIKAIEEFDVLIHLAARTFVPDSFEKPHAFYTTNIMSTLNLLELCRLHKAKMVYASSYVYGVPEYLPIDEKHPVKGFNPYANSKIICERLCEAYHNDFGLRVIIFRQANIYGSGQAQHFLIPKIIREAKNGSVYLKDPSPKRDFVYIDDVVDAYMHGVRYEKSGFEIFNIGSGISYSVEEIVKMIFNYFDDDVQVYYSGEKRKQEIPDTCYDISKAKKRMGWEPKTKTKEGIQKILTK